VRRAGEDGSDRCRATYSRWGFTTRCTSEADHHGKHVGVFTEEHPDDPMDAIWKDSDRGAGMADA
jgi:hypothetical protein